MIGETAELAVKLKLEDRQFASSLSKDEAGLKKLNATVGKTGGAFSAVARNIGGFQANMGRAIGNLNKGVSTAAANIQKLAFVGGALAVGGGIAAVKWAGDFEAQLRTINTIARETPEGLSRIGDSIREIARTTGTPLEELTQGYYDLLSAGIKAADAQNVLTNANKLAIGGLASAAETVDLLTTAINVYGGDASQAARFTDEFAKAIERGKVTAADLAGSYAQVAPLAKSLNIENKELAAGYARLTAAGTPAAEAATQMASAMTALLKKTPDLEKLEKQTKKNYAAIAGSQGLNVALEMMRTDADKAGIELVDLVGRKEALLYILQTTGPNLKAYNADLAAMGNAAGTAAAQMAERQQGLNFQLSILKANIKDAGITIGTALIPKLIPLFEKFNAFIQGNQEGIKRFGADLADAFSKVAQWIGKLDFKQIGDSLKIAATFGRALIQAFLSAPQWLQTAVVTGWGLNKLTGGAVQNIMADLTKAVIGGVLQQFVARGASPANPLFVSDVTGGLAGALGKGGALGLLKGIIPAALILEGAMVIGGAIVDALGGPVAGTEDAGTGREVADIAGVKVVLGQNTAELVRAEDARKRDALKLVQSTDDRGREARAALLKFVQSTDDRGRETRNGLTSLGSTLTAMQVQLHADLQNAIDVLETSTDPAAIAAAAAATVAGVKGGAGSAQSTGGMLTTLKAQRDAALASGNKDLAATLTDAMKQIEPFQKGRQWQSEQIAEARKVVASNKTSAEKLRELKGIEQDLLSHQRKMAADIVSGLEHVVAAIQAIKIPAGTTPEIRNGFVVGGVPIPKPAPEIRNGFVINAKVTTSTRDQTTSAIVRSRHGPTPAQAGAA